MGENDQAEGDKPQADAELKDGAPQTARSEMCIHVSDMLSFDDYLVVPDPATLADIERAVAEAGYTEHPWVLYRLGKQVSRTAKITIEDVAEDDGFVIWNQRHFRPKSYPKVDHVFRSPPTRYAEFSMARAEARGRRPQPRFASRAEWEQWGGLQGVDAGAADAFERALAGANLGGGHGLMDFFDEQIVHAAEQPDPAAVGLAAAFANVDGVDLTDVDRRTVRQLMEATGLDRSLVVQTYCACDRNEAMTLNVLMQMREG